MLAMCPTQLLTKKGLFHPQTKGQTYTHLKFDWSQNNHQTSNVMFFLKMGQYNGLLPEDTMPWKVNTDEIIKYSQMMRRAKGGKH